MRESSLSLSFFMYKLARILFVFVFLLSSVSRGENSACINLFAGEPELGIKQNFKAASGFWQKALSVVMRGPENKPDISLLGGLVRKDVIGVDPTKLNVRIREFFMSGYHFTPAKFIAQGLLDKPILYLTDKIGDRPLQFRVVSKVTALALNLVFLGAPLYMLRDHIFWFEVDKGNYSEIVAHQDELFRDYSSDFLYEQSISEKFKTKNLDKIVPDSFVYDFQHQDDAFLKYLAKIQGKKFDMDQAAILMNHYAFDHLENIVTSGPVPGEGLLIPAEAQHAPTAKQVELLFKTNIDFVLRTMMIRSYFDDPLRFIEYKNAMSVSVYQDIFESNFFLSLSNLYAQNKISRVDFKKKLEQFEYFKKSMQETRILGTAIESDENPGHPITLDEVSRGLLAH